MSIVSCGSKGVASDSDYSNKMEIGMSGADIVEKPADITTSGTGDGSKIIKIATVTAETKEYEKSTEQLKALRAYMPETIFLIPGYGAQGGKAEDIACAFDKDGHGAIVNSSRGIITAHKKAGGDPKTAWRNAALAMKADLTK